MSQMSSDEVDLIWSLLKRSNYDQLRVTVPDDFCWNILHPTDETTMLVAACQFPTGGRKAESILDIIEWLVMSGASLSQKCAKSNKYHYLSKTNDKENIRKHTNQSGVRRAFCYVLHLRLARGTLRQTGFRG